MAKSFIKPTEYVNLIGMGAWLISHGHPGMAIRSSVFLMRKLYDDCRTKEGFDSRVLLYLKLRCHALIVVSKMKTKINEKFPCIWLQTTRI